MPRMMLKETLRAIRASIGRFLAIVCIVALGCGFYAGLRMTSPDMGQAADAFYDGTALYDIEVVSSLGFAEEQVDEVAAIEGVLAAMPAKSTDTMSQIGNDQYVVRVSSFDAEAAQGSVEQDASTVESDDAGYLNRLVLESGRWPEAAGECVLSADRVMGTPAQVGDTVQVLYGSQDLDGVLEVREYTIVGFAHSSAYVSAIAMGSTTLGAGKVEQFAYVTEDNFSADCPYTEVYVSVEGAADAFYGSDEYEDIVGTVRSRLEDAADALAQSRLDGLVADALAEVDDAQAELDAQEADAAAELDSAKAQLADAWATLESSLAEIQSGEAQLADAQAQLDASRSELAASQEDFEAASAAWQVQRAELQEQLDQVEATLAVVADEATKQQLQQQKTALEEGIAAGDAKIAKAQQKIADGQEQIDATQAQIDAKSAELSSGRTAYQEGLSEYYSSQESYEQSRTETLSQIADASEQIARARADIDELEAPDIYVLDRSKNYGVESFSQDATRIDNIAQVFPFIFFLVAALVSLTSMTRMVEEDRTLIGTYKALGYSRAAITLRYVAYAGVASLLGALCGIALLSQVLPAVIMLAYGIIYNVPQPPFPLPIDWGLAALSGGMGVGITLIATWAAVAATLREQAASLMLPRAPAPGKRIFLEHVRPVWARLSFSWKVTCRNMFRYKKRLWMTVIGIAGCTALLLTGLGLHNAIWDIIDKHFGPVVQSNITVVLHDDAQADAVQLAQDAILASEGSGETAVVQYENMQASGADGETHSAVTYVAKDPAGFSAQVDMHDRATGQAIAFDDDAVVVTEKLASQMGVAAGDTFTLFEQDATGNAQGEGFTFTVTGVMEYYVGSAIYIGPAAWEDATGAAPTYQAVVGAASEDDAVREALTDELHAMDDVATVAYNDETIDSYRKMLTSVNMIVVVLVVAALALAVVVLYNLTNINIEERRREIASLKVLGFTPGEVDAYIFREIVMLTVIGAGIGLLLGIWLEGFVVTTAEVDYVMFGREIHAASFLISFAATVGFSGVVLALMRGKLKRISMVESLKTID